MLDRKTIECDFCVIGGGIAGMCAAISAAREGLDVVLMHERPVLGGNASSEIRMWICGAQGANNRETGILEEIALENLYRNPTKNYAVWDTVLYDFIKREEKITLLLNCTCMDAKVEKGNFADNRDTKISLISGYQLTTQCFYDIKAKYYCDSSGDSILAPITGAEYRLGRESDKEYGENTLTKEPDTMTMGMSCLVFGRQTDKKVTYTPPTWAKKLTDKDFENRNPNLYSDWENFWYLELGGDKDTIGDTEEIKDELLSLATGTWDYIKNSGKFDADNWEMDFLGFLPGKRESRRMTGEYTVTQCDITDGVIFDDEIAYGGWPLDDHFPGGFYHRGVPNTNFVTPAPYSLPYRALFSANVENLFFAGRNISMTHAAMSSIRVMATCGLLGEAVGKAAYLACRYDLTPLDIYKEKTGELQSLLQKSDCFLPHIQRQVSKLCKSASFNADDSLRNGFDRAHELFGYTESDYFKAVKGKEIIYSFDRSLVSEIHLVFDSDLNRATLPGSQCEKVHSMRANVRLDSPVFHMPKTLCRDFILYGELDGKRCVILDVKENRRRCYHVDVKGVFDKLILIPQSSYGDGDSVNIISFDFC